MLTLGTHLGIAAAARCFERDFSGNKERKTGDGPGRER
jgi:hypothetical protein